MIEHEINYQYTALINKDGIQIGIVWMSHKQFQQLQKIYNDSIKSNFNSSIHMDTR